MSDDMKTANCSYSGITHILEEKNIAAVSS